MEFRPVVIVTFIVSTLTIFGQIDTQTTTTQCLPGFGSCNGTSRAITCNCLNTNSCDLNQGICIDYQCSLGYAGPPECKTACSGGTFGSNCLLTCHCGFNDTCSPINGYCSGNCHPDWGGTACQTRLPKLTSAPEVANITCLSLQVTWKAWNQATDIGQSGTIASYVLQQRVNYTAENWNSSTWNALTRVPSVDGVTPYFTAAVTLTDAYGSVEYRIITNWFDYGKEFPGLPGPSSPPLRPIVSCAVTTTPSITSQRILSTSWLLASSQTASQSTTSGTTIISTSTLTTATPTATTLIPTTTAPQYVPGPVTSLVAEVQPQASLIRLTWSVPVNLAIGLTSYNVSYTIVGVGDCNTSSSDPWVSIVQPSTLTSFTAYNTVPWRRYQFVVSANNVVGGGPPLNVSIVSQEIVPTGSVGSLLATSVSSRQVSLAWDEVPCSDRGGSLVAYEISLRESVTGGGGNVRRANVTQRVVTFTGLTPFTNYIASVRYFNRIGPGPSSSDFPVSTIADVPSAPRNVLVVMATDTLLQVVWTTPAFPNGIIQRYRVIYWLRGQEGSTTQVILPASQTQFNMTGLTPYTVYCVQVQGQTQVMTNEGWGNRSDPVCNQTREGLATAPIDLNALFINESCVAVQWNEPSTINGILQSYRILYQMKSGSGSGSGPVEIIVSPTQTVCWICSGLTPDTQYNIQVQARTSLGYGSPASIDLWTEIGDPEPPPAPQISTVENTTATIRIDPASLSHGPVAAYFVIVSLLQTSPVGGRTQRSVSQDPAKVIPLPGYTTAQLSTDEVKQTRSFRIGDNQTYLGFTNRPLDVGSWYTIYYVVASSRNGVLVKWSYAQTQSAFQTGTQVVVTLPTSTPPPVSTRSTPGVAAVGGLIIGEKVALGILVPLGILLLVALILLLLYCCWWRKRKQPYDEWNTTWLQYYASNYMDPSKQQNRKWNDIYSVEEPRHVVTSGVGGGAAGGGGGGIPADISANDLNRKRNTISFEDEYRQLPVGLVFRCSEAEKPENENKNRFDHLAYDHTRVKLNSIDPGDGGTDYYNANYIPGYDRRLRAYIAAQSPFNPQTICDFWLMVYEQNVSKIVLINQLLEDCIVKSEKYWSDDSLTHPYGSIAVTLTRTERFADFVVRSFAVAKMGSLGARRVTQFQFTAWPEHGVPADPAALLEFRRKVGTSPDSPMLVHCGTGVSRSAVFIAIDFCLAKAEAENSVNVFRCCSTMRQCRTMMVRTLKQYIFVYNALFEALVTSPLVVDTNVKAVYDSMKKSSSSSSSTGVNQFRDQFQLLERYLDAPTKDLCTTALSPQNLTKNRFSTLHLVVKDSDLIPLRSSEGPTRTSYINAVAVDSYCHRKAFIVTQDPLASTVADFWCLVYGQRIRSIVSLSGQSFREDSCIDYLPSVSRSLQKVDGGYYVTVLDQQQTDHVTIRTIQLSREDDADSGGRRRVRQLRHYQFQSWKMYDQCPWSNDGFLQLIELINNDRSDDLFVVPTGPDPGDSSSPDGSGGSGGGGDGRGGGRREPPVLVHCIDGASQSGLFCACYIVCQKMALDGKVDVFHSIQRMKRKRFHFVNSVEQYKYVFKLLWDFVNTRMTV